MKKINLSSELAYIIGVVFLALSVAIVSAADFGVSMVVAPAYILSLKVGFLTFGQSEYVVGAILFTLLCIIVKRIKPTYFFSFFTCLFYGAVLDLFRLIPMFNPEVCPPSSYNFFVRIIFFIVGELITTFSVAMAFKTYLYPQVNDFFVKGIAVNKNLDLPKLKRIYDFSFFAIGVIMSLTLFGKFVGIGVGTVILTAINGVLIGFFSKLIDKIFIIKPSFPKIAKYFEI